MRGTWLRHLLCFAALAFPTSMRPNGAEAEAIRFVEQLGGVILRNDQKPGKPVMEVGLTGADLTDDGVAELAGLKALTSLRIGATGITDEGLKHLAGMTALTELNIGETRITDAGLKHLAPLTALTRLDVRRTRVKDSGLNSIGELKNLTALVLTATEITDDGLAVATWKSGPHGGWPACGPIRRGGSRDRR